MRRLAPVALLLAAACQPLAGPATPAATPGLAFAQDACGGCHAVARYGDSPHPEAPPFAGIVNQPGLTRSTLDAWLRDAHNYPEEMDVRLDQPAIDALVAYMLTLRDEAYRPPI